MRGNVFDFAVAVIVGSAFDKIAASFTQDILLPPIGLFLGHVDFRNRFITLWGGRYATLDQARQAGAVTLNYGIFLNALIDFLVIAFAIFVLVKAVNRLKAPEPVSAPASKECPFCISTIPVKAIRCPHCTSALHGSAPDQK